MNQLVGKQNMPSDRNTDLFAFPSSGFNLLKPKTYFMYHQFNAQQFHVLPTQIIYVFCMGLRTNCDYFPIQHLLIGFYNRGRECLLRGTNWVFKSDG